MRWNGIRADSSAPVGAALTGNREPVFEAAMLDPHTAAELAPEQVCRLVDGLLAAHRAMVSIMA
jgi:alpha-galactosidase/6-phospho-beta-glucosidase family protein